MVLVCTHGVRDACCAIKGRPIAGAVAKALASSDVEVLECSHLNGHRFAGTALTLPMASATAASTRATPPRS
jgi:hypothetical protein